MSLKPHKQPPSLKCPGSGRFTVDFHQTFIRTNINLSQDIMKSKRFPNSVYGVKVTLILKLEKIQQQQKENYRSIFLMSTVVKVLDKILVSLKDGSVENVLAV